ncbi:MAG: hypothetical protein J5825_11615 [Lachnospiraceae bacterium]|nr:hypothetical protein [Lachnospiraceae bacterium]
MKRYLKNGLILAVSASMAASMLTGCAKYVDPKNYDTTIVATYNGWDITLSEANFVARLAQYQKEAWYGYFQYEINWSDEVDTGISWQESIKTEAMKELLQTALLCSKAEEYGISLSEEDKAEVAEKVQTDLASFPKTIVEYGSATEEVVTKVYTNNALANRVWEYMSKDIDTTIENDEDYRHKTCHYVMVSLPSSTTESETGSEPVSGLETDLNKVITEIKEKLDESDKAEGIDALMTNLAQEYKAKGYEAINSYVNVDKNDSDSYGPACFKLSQGETTIYDAGKDGIYLFYCTDDNNQTAKQNAINKELDKRKDALFNEKYKELTESVEPYKVEDRIWKGVNFDTHLYNMNKAEIPFSNHKANS